MKSLLFAILLLPTLLLAQQRQLMSIELQKELKTFAPEQHIDLYLRGEISSLVSFVRTNEGRVKGTLNNILACSLPASKISMLNELEGLEFIEFSASIPQVLNEVMLANNNVIPVHLGASPLPQAYLGDDVIMGFIDTGIELAHPDFQNEDGTTRVIALWDQTQGETIPFRVPQPYGYGQEWNSEDINLEISGHDDQASFYGHGSTVVGVGAGNGNATGQFAGVAPNADIIMISSDFNHPNWSATVADAIDFIFAKAEALGKPAVVNLSLGDYFGSHDGLDASTLFTDQLLEASPGRAIVAAAGNSGNLGNYHLAYDIPEVDTTFTWFKYNSSAQAVYFELWADTVDFNSTSFAIGADLTVPAFSFKGYSGWRTATENVNTIITDTIFYQEAMLGIVDTWIGLRGAQYQIQVQVTQPFSNQYLWRFATTGGGKFDCWSHAPFGTSEIVQTNLPDAGTYPAMVHYKLPDNKKTIVNSWVCSDKVITVGNYVNRNSWINYLGEETVVSSTPGAISINCSRGPTRDNRQKPDIAASGDHTLSAGRIATLNSWININPEKVAQDGMHYINGGTSLASPVVAGVAGLYFSRDSAASWLEVKNAIIDNALADMFTGILPGNQFGYGKVDAFATLTTPFQSTVGLTDYSSEFLAIYPNPSGGQFYIQSKNDPIKSIRIFDIAGRLILQKSDNFSIDEAYLLDLTPFKSGVYVLQSELISGVLASAKLILEK
ncbi:S8 family serine peptidase [Cryomorpha ignava]|uniref:S8 family serine peptidase n=1 Tax=Cryomorpha ignava TaxID=101383 RepID=A0A7K3WPC4_9FLAO|nr:S8 family serine peptidase [Cryomorpha ignava]NEN22881.1 S8 family serine peptidase [Cryomorpha ignava]